MRIALFSTKPYDEQFFTAAAQGTGHQFTFFEPRLTVATAPLADGHGGVCAFVNDELNSVTLEILAAHGVRLIALRCAGFNNVDLHAAHEYGLTIVRVPAYSPYAVAEHTVGLMLTLNRKFHKAYYRVREGNFALDGLLGFDLRGRTAGVVGTGQIGQCVIAILRGFGCRVLAYDVHQSPACTALGAEYVPLDRLLSDSDIISLHCPLVPATHHLINAGTIAQMRPGVMLINTGRGALIDTRAAIEGLKSKRIGYLGLDVYEEESDLFFEDHSANVIQDDVFTRLLTFPNVLITGHQAFFTRNALEAIAQTTLASIDAFAAGRPLVHQVSPRGA